MLFYHATTAENAKATLAEDFKNHERHYPTSETRSGVWLSNIPLDENDADEDRQTLLEVTLDLVEADVEFCEWVEEGKTYREWLISAEILNPRTKVRIVDTLEDEDDLTRIRQEWIDSLRLDL